jgi:hypothetical protein
VARRLLSTLMAVMAVVVTLFAFVPVSAAQGGWEAWFYNPARGNVTRINQSGAVVGETFLPISQAFNSFGQDVAISPNGRYIAFTMYDSTASTPNIQLSVYDLEIGAVRFNYDISAAAATSLEYRRPDLAFDQANQQFAFGALYPDGWEIVIANLATESVLNSLSSSANGLGQAPAQAVPVITHYDGQFVNLILVPENGSNQGNYPAYRWNIGTNEIVTGSGLTSLDGDRLMMTGETVQPVHDDVLAASASGAQNVLSVFDPGAGPSFPMYHNAEANLQEAHFIEGGARVLVEAVQGDGQRALIVVNRDGSVYGTLIGALDRLYSTPDGFVGVFGSDGGVALAHVDTTASLGQPQTIWAGGDSNWVLAHVRSDQVQTDFAEWQPLQ